MVLRKPDFPKWLAENNLPETGQSYDLYCRVVWENQSVVFDRIKRAIDGLLSRPERVERNF